MDYSTARQQLETRRRAAIEATDPQISRFETEVGIGELSKTQQKVVRNVVRYALEHEGRLVEPSGAELKEFKISRIVGRTFSVIVEAGREGDEGTMLALVGRYRRHLFIGPRGGITAPHNRNQGNARGWKDCVIYNPQE